jgi:4-amino-4-deoxy-L-arabinose transferase-like glycosyltransferase
MEERRVGVPVWLGLLAIVLFAAAVRVRLLDVPLERDEGEYAYAAQLMLSGVPPYEQLYSMKLPGVWAAYAAFLALFGQTQRAIHAGLLLVNVATIVLVFRLAWRWGGALSGLTAAACFALLSAGRATHGLFANAEHFVLPLVVAGWLLLPGAVATERRGRLIWGGVLLGLGILMKQHAVIFTVGALIYVFAAEVGSGRTPRHGALRSGWLAAGVALPLVATAVGLALAGTFNRFWFWAIVYARRYAGEVPLSDAIALFRLGAGDVVGSMPLLWLLAGGGLVALFWAPQAREARTFMGLFVISSALAVVPGFFFRPHYFLLVLPAAASLAGLAVGSLARIRTAGIRESVWSGAAVALATLCVAGSLFQSRGYLLEATPTEVSRATFGLNAFPESIPIADYIRRHSVDGDTVAVLGSEPQICFYARRRSATGYVYMYEMMRPHEYAGRMQEELIREVTQADPKFVVFVRIEDSWSREESSKNLIFEWFDGFAEARYERVGLVTIEPDRTEYHWAPDVPWPPDAHYWLLLLQRKD